MKDWPRHIEHWRTGALEDMDTAEILLEKKKLREALSLSISRWEKAQNLRQLSVRMPYSDCCVPRKCSNGC